MHKIFLVVASVMLLHIYHPGSSDSTAKREPERETAPKKAPTNDTHSYIRSVYDSLNVSSILKYEAFEEAMIGHKSIPAKKKDILTVIDFTLPSTEKRMYVIDLKRMKLLYHSIVSHGRNSGNLYAKNFSNRHGSFQSSLGFYLTGETYHGGNGFSLRLDGLERGINDQARPRAVVIHGADYCSERMIKSTGRLGRSYGCPALPRELNGPIINTIKNGSLLYIYAGSKEYLANSDVLRNKLLKRETLLAQHEESTEAEKAATPLLN